MIQTTKAVFCKGRLGTEAIILIKIEGSNVTDDGIYYTVNDYILDIDGNLERVNSKQVFYDNAQIAALDAYLESVNDCSGMSKSEKEKAKQIDALFYNTQTELYSDGTTIYRLTPADWVKSVLIP